METINHLIDHILKEGIKLKDHYFDDEPVALDHISIYTKDDKEFDDLIKKMEKNGTITHSVANGVYFELAREVHVIDDVWVVKHVKISKPSPQKTQTGSITLVAKNFKEFKETFGDVVNMDMVKEEEYRKLTLFDKNFDVVLYIASSHFVNLEANMVKGIEEKDQAELEQIKNELKDEKHKRLELMADFQNFQKRVENEKTTWAALANMSLIQELLEVYDDIQLALQDEHLTLDHAKASMKAAQDKLKVASEAAGIERIEVKVGDEFNKDRMEAVSTIAVKDEKQKNKVVAVISSAYKYKGKDFVLKPAKVVVGK